MKKTHPKKQMSSRSTTPKPHFKILLGLWQDFYGSRAAKVVIVERDQELPLCVRNTAPGGSKTDLPLAKVEPIINFGDVSIITYLRKGKKYWVGAV